MSKKDITFLRVNYLRGPNIWTYRPVIEAWVDIGAFEQLPSNLLPGFNERLIAWLPGLDQHRCGVGEPGGFILRLHEGTWLGHVLEHVTIELQNLAGSKVGFGKARQTAEGSGIYKVAVRTRDERVGRAAIAAARELVLAAVDGTAFDLAKTVTELRELVDRHCLGPSTACIVDAAATRKIPSIRLNDGNLVQLGYGVKQRRIWTAETDRTSAIAEGISRDKDLTKSLLTSCGVPVPEGRTVESPAEAWAAAEDIGLPVAIKPVDGNHGRGVSLELMTQEEVEAAYPIADAEGSGVIVERFIPGDEHRLLVVGNQLVAACRGSSIHIVGDGIATVRTLIDSQLNTDPRRGDAEEFPLETIVLDREPGILLLLQRQKLGPDSIPAAGQKVLIQRTGTYDTDVTDDVHPETARLACLAARVVGLDIAGIDLVVEDVSRPLEAQRGAIVEVNAGPSLLMHLKPAIGQPRPVGEAIARELFPEAEPGRIPVVGITGQRGASQIARLTAWIVQLSGRHVGLACADGLFIDRRCIGQRDPLGFDGAQSILMNRRVDTVVIQGTARGILEDGLPYDRCQVGVVTDLDGVGDLGEYYLSEDEQLFNVLRTQVDVVFTEGAAVLNAADSRLQAMAELCDGSVVFYAEDRSLPIMAEHRAKGGRVVFTRDERIVLAAGDAETLLRRSTVLGSPGCSLVLENVLAAAATAWALGIDPDLIGAGIETYEDSVARTAAAVVS